MSDSAQPVARPSPRPPRHRLRLVNAVPSRGMALFLGSLPFLAVAIAYLVASAARLAVNAGRQAAAVAGADVVGPSSSSPPCRTSAPAISSCWDDTWPACCGCFRRRHRDARSARARRRHRLHPARPRAAAALRRASISRDPAAGAAADPVHRLRPRRNLEGDADRHRRRAGDGARHRASASPRSRRS